MARLNGERLLIFRMAIGTKNKQQQARQRQASTVFQNARLEAPFNKCPTLNRADFSPHFDLIDAARASHANKVA